MKGRKQNIELRNQISELLSNGLNVNEIKQELDNKLNGNSPHIETIKRYKKILKINYYKQK